MSCRGAGCRITRRLWQTSGRPERYAGRISLHRASGVFMKRLLAVSIASLAVVAAGCGSSSDNSSTGSSSSSSGSSTPSGSSSAAKSGTVAVDIKDFAFNPKDLTVKKGTKITWTNDDSTAHNVVAGDGTFKSGT